MRAIMCNEASLNMVRNMRIFTVKLTRAKMRYVSNKDPKE